MQDLCHLLKSKLKETFINKGKKLTSNKSLRSKNKHFTTSAIFFNTFQQKNPDVGNVLFAVEVMGPWQDILGALLRLNATLRRHITTSRGGSGLGEFLCYRCRIGCCLSGKCGNVAVHGNSLSLQQKINTL